MDCLPAAGGPGEGLRIVISSNPKLLSVLRGVVRYRASACGFPKADAEALGLAVSEAAAHLIRQSNQNRPEAQLALEIRELPDRMEFYLEDSGPRARLETGWPRRQEEAGFGGEEGHFVSKVMDSTRYGQDFAGGNRLKMTKFFPRKVSSGIETANSDCRERQDH